MSSELQPFLISEFKTGQFNYLKPWRRPNEAFDPLTNAYVYRGVVSKRQGSTQFGNQLTDQQPVMGIMQWINESTATTSLIVNSTKNSYLYSPGSTPTGGTFSALTQVGGNNSTFWWGIVGTSQTTLPATGSMASFWNNIKTSSITVSAYNASTNALLGTVTDNGLGTAWNVTAGTFFTGTGTITSTITGGYYTASGGNAWVLFNFGINSPMATTTVYLTLTCQVQNYFTGNNTNFFNWTNWQPTNLNTFVSSSSNLYMTNNVDPVTIYDGTNLSRPMFYVNSTFTQSIIKCIDIRVFQNRLLMFRPTIAPVPPTIGTNILLNQTIYYSALFNPLNFIGDIAGNGGEITPATGDILLSSEQLRDGIVLFFTNSTWFLRSSGVVSPAFTVLKLNVSKTSNAPYCTIAYDERCTSMGSTGFIACDGNYVSRYDIPIIDYYETNISEQYYAQTFGFRYDNLNQAWMLYVSNLTENPVVGSGAPGSDSALVYNFVENIWSTYKFSDPMTCLGSYFAQSGWAWDNYPFPWGEANASWNSTSSQKTAPILLGGDTSGYVYWLANEDSVADDELPITGEIIATGNGGKEYSGTLANPPIVPLTFTGGWADETFYDDGCGNLWSNLNTQHKTPNGYIDYEDGEWAISFVNVVPSMTSITANYTYGLPITVDIASTRWNPSINLGEKTQFCYLDVYYKVLDYPEPCPIQLQFDFYVNNSGIEGPVAASKILTMDGPVDSDGNSTDDYAWKRIFLNLVGEFIQFEMIVPPTSYGQFGQFQILGMVLWTKPSGRLTMP